MTLESIGVFLQGVGTVLLAAVTAIVGWRAAGALRLRIEGPITIDAMMPGDEDPSPIDEFRESA